MKKIKYLPTRKKKAIRRWALVIVLALCSSFVTHFSFLPVQSLRIQEDDRLTGQTKIISRYFESPIKIPGIQMATISESDNALVYCLHSYNLLIGWYPLAGAEVDLSQAEKPVNAAVLHISCQKTEESGAVVVGKILDERIRRIDMEADFSAYEWIYKDQELPENYLLGQITLPDGTNGKDVFYLPIRNSAYPNGEDSPFYFKPLMNCYDANGKLIYSESMEWAWSTSIG